MILPEHEPSSNPEKGMKVSFKKNESDDPLFSKDFLDSLINAKRLRQRQDLATRSLSFSIGLFLSLMIVVTLFEWKTYDNAGEVNLSSRNEKFDELLEIPITQQPPPPPQKKLQQPNIIESPVEEIIEEIEIDFDIEITDETVVEKMDTEGLEDLMTEENPDEIFTIVEHQPRPQDGMQGFMTYLAKNIKYPRAAIINKVQGKVFVQFVVNTDGSLVDFEVIKGIGSGCDEEAIRVLKKAPKWIPGKQRGKPVRVRILVPVFFRIQ